MLTISVHLRRSHESALSFSRMACNTKRKQTGRSAGLAEGSCQFATSRLTHSHTLTHTPRPPDSKQGALVRPCSAQGFRGSLVEISEPVPLFVASAAGAALLLLVLLLRPLRQNARPWIVVHVRTWLRWWMSPYVLRRKGSDRSEAD